MAQVKIAIAKTPKQAEKIGKTFTDSVIISKADAIELREGYYNVEKARLTTFALIGIASPIIGKLLTESIGTFLGTVTGASGLMQSFFEQMGDKFKDLVDTMSSSQRVTFVYKYKRLGSNDGFYWLTDVK